MQCIGSPTTRGRQVEKYMTTRGNRVEVETCGTVTVDHSDKYLRQFLEIFKNFFVDGREISRLQYECICQKTWDEQIRRRNKAFTPKISSSITLFERNSSNMNGAKLLLACMALSIPACLAVTCDSFTDPEQCNGVMTDAGECMWNEEESVCELGAGGLPDGMVGITAVPESEGGMCQVLGG